MKKILLATLLISFFSLTANAQQGGFSAGAHVGLRLSDASIFNL